MAVLIFCASASLQIHSFENGCSYVHNSHRVLEARQIVWGSSVPAAPCAQVSSAAQTVSAIQSGVNIVVYQAHVLPSTRSRYGMANVFKVISSRTRVFMHWDTMAILPSPEILG